jgi:hypothetical protein
LNDTRECEVIGSAIGPKATLATGINSPPARSAIYCDGLEPKGEQFADGLSGRADRVIGAFSATFYEAVSGNAGSDDRGNQSGVNGNTNLTGPLSNIIPRNRNRPLTCEEPQWQLTRYLMS